MRLNRVVLLWIVLAAGGPAFATQLEIAGNVGQAFPFYKQSFEYDPGPVQVQVSGLVNVDLQQKGQFSLDAEGGPAYGGAVTVYVVPHFGIEGRLDSGKIDVAVREPRFHVTIDLPSPVPDISTDISLGTGAVEIEPLRPVSVNFKLKTPGPVALTVSGGLSYLPTLTVSAIQSIGLGVTSFDGTTSGLTVGSIAFRAAVRADSTNIADRIGGNIGAGLRLGLGGPLALTAEGRYFYFPKHRIEWEPVIEGPLSAVEEKLLTGVRSRLEPIELYPALFQLTVGASLTF